MPYNSALLCRLLLSCTLALARSFEPDPNPGPTATHGLKRRKEGAQYCDDQTPDMHMLFITRFIG